MRLSEAKLREGLKHPDADVRSLVAEYLMQERATDPELMPAVIQAIEEYGRDEAFWDYQFMADLRQSEETVAWLVQQLELHDEATDEEVSLLAADLEDVLLAADSASLRAWGDVIQNAEHLEPSLKQQVAERIRLFDAAPELVWTELEQLMDRQKDQEWTLFDEDHDYLQNLLDALAPQQELLASRALEIVQDRDRGSDDPRLHAAILLAGRLRLDEVVPRLIELYQSDDSQWIEDAAAALRMIGTDTVVRGLAESFRDAPIDLRAGAASLLRLVHSDSCVQTCLELAAGEPDREIRGDLLRSALMNLAAEAIEPTRQFVLTAPLTEDVLDTRALLLRVCKLLGERFPEFDEWSEDAVYDVGIDADFDWEPVARHDAHFPPRSDYGTPDYGSFDPLPTFVKADAHVGRNDPCPCGSGKKFKKCCYGKS